MKDPTLYIVTAILLLFSLLLGVWLMTCTFVTIIAKLSGVM